MYVVVGHIIALTEKRQLRKKTSRKEFWFTWRSPGVLLARKTVRIAWLILYMTNEEKWTNLVSQSLKWTKAMLCVRRRVWLSTEKEKNSSSKIFSVLQYFLYVRFLVSSQCQTSLFLTPHTGILESGAPAKWDQCDSARKEKQHWCAPQQKLCYFPPSFFIGWTGGAGILKTMERHAVLFRGYRLPRVAKLLPILIMRSVTLAHESYFLGLRRFTFSQNILGLCRMATVNSRTITFRRWIFGQFLWIDPHVPP